MMQVLHVTTAAAIATAAQLGSEFTISDADEIDNAAGTDTSSDQLWVLWEVGGPGESVVGMADEAVNASAATLPINVRIRS